MFSQPDILVLGSRKDDIVKAQYEPFEYSKNVLKDQFGLKVKFKKIEKTADSLPICLKTKAKSVFIIPFWGESPEDVKGVMEEIKKAKPDLQLVFVDPWAQASSTYFSLLSVVDCFLKRQCYKDKTQYYRKFIGGSALTEYLATEGGYQLENWHVGSNVGEGLAGNIKAGWSLGTADKFRKLCLNEESNLTKAKTIDIFCRMSLGNENKKEWYHEYRESALECVRKLENSYNCAVSGGYNQGSLIPKSQYYSDLESSKVVFSPFGWGETCWRDFEAIVYGGLLIKPSMEHLEINPSIFVDGETYVACKWDFSDFEEKLAYYLEHEDERIRIVRNAHKVYKQFFEEHEFAKLIAGIVNG
jgi:hypothetical protein